MRRPLSPPLIALLAAGRAARFGADKLSQPLAGTAVGQHAAQAALATGLPVLCIGTAARPAWLPTPARFAPNPAAAEGLGSSVALAARLAAKLGHSALLIHLTDMPLVPVSLLLDLAAGTWPAACRHGPGQVGVPAIVPARDYTVLGALHGDRGAGAVLGRLPELRVIDCPAGWLHDIDTPAALVAAEAIYAAQHEPPPDPSGDPVLI